ncbi:MAG: NADH dehydrogenase [ubiquinone] 1 alpha subcomplex assembly factor 1 [Planctomycetota bacterium]|jgi:NADH dehydrogenase [ubiquinone] 1 alpha subcomplex assembly factor 1
MSTLTRLLFTLSLVAATMTLHSQEKVLTDFTDAEVAESWITVNDNVMGGRSKGGPSFTGDRLIFAGSTNTNGGGFSSIRTKPIDWELGEFDGLIMRVKGSKRTFQFDLGIDGSRSRRRVSFRAEFVPESDWSEVRIPFSDFKPTFFGRVLEGREAPALSRDRIATIGFFIYDKIDGPFELEVDWVKAYRKGVAKVSRKSVAKVSRKSPANVNPSLVIPDAEEGRYRGFLSGRFSVRATGTSMVSNLTAAAGEIGGLNFKSSPQSRLIASGFDALGRLEYLRLYQPIVFRSQLYAEMAALRGAKSDFDFATVVRGLEQGDSAASALVLALWAEIDRVAPGTTCQVALGIKSGKRVEFQEIRSFVLERSKIDIAGKMKTVVAMGYLKASFPSSVI